MDFQDQDSYTFKGYLLPTKLMPRWLVEKRVNYDKFREDDILVCVFPKSGSNFLAAILRSIVAVSRNCPVTEVKGSYLEVTPPGRSEADTDNDMENVEHRRVILSHLPWDLMPPAVQQGKVKTITIFRDPRAVLSSLYYFSRGQFAQLTSESVPMDKFIDNCMKPGHFPFNGYYAWTRLFYPNRNMDNMMVVYYEDLLEDLESGVRAIAAYIGVELTAEQIQHVVQENKFENKLKSDDHMTKHFLRKGKVDSWKTEMPPEIIEKVEKWIREESVGLEGIRQYLD